MKVVNESKKVGRVWSSYNSTYIALIPKGVAPSSFEDFLPISCCNLIYKLIAKLIENRLKPIFSDFLSEEQYRFLFNHQIHDAVSITQEVLHSIKLKKSPSFVCKLDLSKTYDRAIWTFIRHALVQLGMNLETANWIMGCLDSPSFVVLINSVPSPSFLSSRGLRQGFLLSPFLFLLVAEGLSLLIKKARREGLLKGTKISKS